MPKEEKEEAAGLANASVFGSVKKKKPFKVETQIDNSGFLFMNKNGATNGTVDENTDAATKTPKSKKLGSTKTDEAKNVKSMNYLQMMNMWLVARKVDSHLSSEDQSSWSEQVLQNLTTASKDKDEMEDEALEMVVKGFKFYRKEYKRLVVENGELWQENQKIKKAYDALKAGISIVGLAVAFYVFLKADRRIP